MIILGALQQPVMEEKAFFCDWLYLGYAHLFS